MEWIKNHQEINKSLDKKYPNVSVKKVLINNFNSFAFKSDLRKVPIRWSDILKLLDLLNCKYYHSIQYWKEKGFILEKKNLESTYPYSIWNEDDFVMQIYSL